MRGWLVNDGLTAIAQAPCILYIWLPAYTYECCQIRPMAAPQNYYSWSHMRVVCTVYLLMLAAGFSCHKCVYDPATSCYQVPLGSGHVKSYGAAFTVGQFALVLCT